MQEGKTIGQLMEEMRQKAGAQNYHGHDYMDLQRFAENTEKKEGKGVVFSLFVFYHSFLRHLVLYYEHYVVVIYLTISITNLI